MKPSTVLPCLWCVLLLAGCDSGATEPPPQTAGATLPSEIAGTLLDILEVPHDRIFDPADEGSAAALARLGVAASDLRLLFARPRDSIVDLQLGAFQVAGWEWATRLRALAGEMEAASGGALAFDVRDVGGKSVQRVIDSDQPLRPAYYYPVGDVLFFLSTADQGMAADALSLLPPGPGAAGASSAAAAAGSASAAPLPERSIFLYLGVVSLPAFPACVGWPTSSDQEIVAQATVYGDAGLVPLQVHVTAHTPFGQTNPPGTYGFVHTYHYQSNQFGLGSADRIELFGHVAGGASSEYRSPLSVQHCLNGRWVDGPRILRIQHDFEQVTANIESGTLSCEEGGQAFSGTLSPSSTLGAWQGSDLKACNPPACVNAGHLEKTELRDFRAMVSDDGYEVDVEWDQQLFDREYDDEGNLTACPRAEVVPASFSISRLDWGPEKPWGGSP